MDAILGFLNDPLVLTVIQLLFGLEIKRLPSLASVPNKLIPVLNGVLAILIKLGGPGVAHASGLGDSLRGFGGLLLDAGLQTLLTTGVHSSAKNLWQNLILASFKKR